MGFEYGHYLVKYITQFRALSLHPLSYTRLLACIFLGYHTVFGLLFSRRLDWGLICEGTVGPVVITVFFEHKTDFPHQIKHSTSQ